MQQRFTVDELSLTGTWSQLRSGLQKPQRKGIDSLFMLVSWQLWKARNEHIFRSELTTASRLVEVIKNEAKLWITAGVRFIGSLIPGE
uniref:Uncharacterized protein n=1 Tax=Arundo donax TaxID=35708 RepID=A0A0A8Z4L2_ARUDO